MKRSRRRRVAGGISRVRPHRLSPYSNSNTTPFDVRIDGNGDGWVSDTGTSQVSKFKLTKNRLVWQFSRPIGANIRPKGMAIDTRNNIWVTAGAADAVYAFDQNGNPFGPFSGGALCANS